jgi:putative acetyltransferase
MVTLRPYRPDDAPALLALFRDTIRRVNIRDYSLAQVAAWASDGIDTVVWFGRFTGRYVPVAEEAGRPVGFAELESNGHIDRVYVSADHQRRGIGRQLLDAVVAEARRVGLDRLFTEASITARPFFEAHGFTTLAPQVVTCRGAEFVNYRMERVIGEPHVGVGAGGATPEPVSLLMIQFLDWVASRPRTYAAAMDAWRTSCPRLSVWEDALIGNLIRVGEVDAGGAEVALTSRGHAVLAAGGPAVPAQRVPAAGP